MRNPLIFSFTLTVALGVGFTAIILGAPMALLLRSNADGDPLWLFALLVIVSPFIGAFFLVKSFSWGPRLTAALWAKTRSDAEVTVSLLTYSNKSFRTLRGPLGKNFGLLVAMYKVLASRETNIAWHTLAFSVFDAFEKMAELPELLRSKATVPELITMFEVVSGSLKHFNSGRVGEAGVTTVRALAQGWTPEFFRHASAEHGRAVVLTALEHNIPLEYALAVT